MSLCMNCNSHGADDMEVISNLIKIRLKPKVLLNHYMLCVRCVGCLFDPGIQEEKKKKKSNRCAVLAFGFQRASERTQRQPRHDGEAGDL